ncbi:MAG: hypothetical protein R2909_17735 [Gemmatimonadales bacterium]
MTNEIYKVPIEGGRPQSLGTAPGTFNGMSWSSTGVLVVSGNTAIHLIPEAGGPSRVLSQVDREAGEVYQDAVQVVDDAGIVLYSSWGPSSSAGARARDRVASTGENGPRRPGHPPVGHRRRHAGVRHGRRADGLPSTSPSAERPASRSSW